MSTTYANLRVDRETYNAWREECDRHGMKYGARVTVLMKKDIEDMKKD